MTMAGHDNRNGAPARPFDVTQDELERAVRETFAQRAAVPRPLTADPAGVAIRRARRIQRQRTLAGLALAAVATVGVSTGVAQLGDGSRTQQRPTVVLGDPSNLARPEPLPSGTGPAVGPSVAGTDLLVGNTIIASNGRRVTLAALGPAERVQRLPEDDGWLVTGVPTAAGRTLWAVSPDGAAQVLLAGADVITVAADGRQVAWRDNEEIVAAGLVSRELIAPVRTPAPATAAPVGFVGNAVLVRLDRDRPGHVLWHPAAGPVSAGPDRRTLAVYGALPDGRLVGQVTGSGRAGCLALLDPSNGFAPTDSACGAAVSGDGLGAISPDGRWLVVNGRADGSDAALLVDLSRFGATVPVHPAGPPLTGAVAWSSADEAAYVDGSGQLVRLRVERIVAGERAMPEPVPGTDASNRPVVVVRS